MLYPTNYLLGGNQINCNFVVVKITTFINYYVVSMYMSEPRIIAQTEWMSDISENSPLYRGVSCLEHLINEYYSEKDINP